MFFWWFQIHVSLIHIQTYVDNISKKLIITLWRKIVLKALKVNKLSNKMVHKCNKFCFAILLNFHSIFSSSFFSCEYCLSKDWFNYKQFYGLMWGLPQIFNSQNFQINTMMDSNINVLTVISAKRDLRVSRILFCVAKFMERFCESCIACWSAITFKNCAALDRLIHKIKDKEFHISNVVYEEVI